MKTKFVMLALTMCFWIGYNQVQAEIITIEISGEVTNGYGSLWGDTIHEGSTFNGTYTYETSTEDTSGDTSVGAYIHNSPFGITLSLGGFEFKTTSTHTGQFKIIITNDIVFNVVPYDWYDVISLDNAILSNGATIDEISWRLFDNSHMALSSTDLPIVAPVLNQWGSNDFTIHGVDSANNFNISGTVTQAILVPEPLTITLMVASGILFLKHRR